MAGLDKYEASEEWKNNFKKLLFMERKTVQTPSNLIVNTQRYSRDIGEDLQNILKEKNIPCGTLKSSKKMFEHEDKENDSSKQNSVYSKDFNNSKDIVEDTTLYDLEKSHNKQDISDESFEAMEKICNKTASDPDSTLFKYIHSDNKRRIIEDTKKRLSSINASSSAEECDADEETAAVNRLLKDLRGNSEIEHHGKNNEMTQIEDIEEPSQFWDNTTIVQTSPVKMVGLLRPSTILEEAGGGYDDSEVTSSSAQTSYTSAQKVLPSEISSSCYETASETVSTENARDPLCIDDFKIEVDADCMQEDHLIDLSETKNLMEFENSTKNINNNQITENCDSESEESIIELLSDDDDDVENPLSPFYKNDGEVTSPSCEYQTTLIKWDTPFNIKKEISSLNNSERNMSHESPNVECNNSLNFNDTLEEVEYMIKKGMELIEAQNAIEESDFKASNHELPTPNLLKERQNTFTKSPVKEKPECQSQNIGVKLETTPKCTPKYKSPYAKCEDRFALNIKPIPKLELFKKPTSASKKTQLGARPKDHFAHVVSPIATYVKKTAVTPFMTSVRTKIDNSYSGAFRELEYESQLHKSKVNSTFEAFKLEKNSKACSLPKKAYISSEFRQITDERSPVTIPGGKNIQKYLDSAITPAVICHVGKANLPSSSSKLPVKLQKGGDNQSNTPKRNEPVKDMSLTDFSIISGDVSVYTIKDAQKL